MPEVVFGIDPSSFTPHGDAIGFVSFGGWCEEFGVSLRCWAPDVYLAQWRRSLAAIARGEQDAVITSIDDPLDPGTVVWTWAFYPEEGRVFMRNRILVLTDYQRDFEPEDVRSWIEPRTSPDGPVSEWSMPAARFRWAVGVARLWRGPRVA